MTSDMLERFHSLAVRCEALLGLCVLALFVTAPVQLPAQQITARVVGTVTDQSGAVIPGAVVTIHNIKTGQDRTAETNAAGNYEFPFLVVGRYSLSATSPGFQRTEVSGFGLTVDQVARVDVTLQVGQVTETVQVDASAIGLQTENASVGTVIDADKVAELPLNGRSFVQLALLAPGVVPGTPGSISVRRKRGSLGQDVGMAANGSRDIQNRFYFDGIEAMDLDGYSFSFSPSIDGIQEFKVQTSTYSAAVGGAPGGQVNLTTKSGTNAYHGTLWWFNRNDAFAATAPFQPYSENRKVPKLNRNQFGANIGGPIIKQKTFFFFNWESGRQVAGTFGATALVPPTPFRSGDFSSSSQVIFDPDTGDPFPGNRIPAERIKGYARKFLDGFVPEPNTNEPAINFRGKSASAPIDQDQYIGRIDHRFSDNNTLYGSYMYNIQEDRSVPALTDWEFGGNRARGQQVSLTDTHIFSPTVINEVRAGWHRFTESGFFGTTGDPALDIANLIGIQGVSTSPRDYGAPDFGGAGFDLPGTGDEGPRDRLNQNWQVSDNLTVIRGAHSLSIGGTAIRRNWTFDEALFPRGIFTFDGRTVSGGADPGEEHQFATFLLGHADSSTVSVTPFATRQNNWWYSTYFQDDWKINRNLTINFGLRYEYFSSVSQRGPMSNFELNGTVPGFSVSRQTFWGFDNIPNSSGTPKNLVRAPKANFGPRIGFAYSPEWTTGLVIRGGYGLYRFPEATNTYLNLTTNPPIIGFTEFIGDFSDTVNPETALVGGGEEVRDSLEGANAFDPYQSNSYSQHWNFTVQKQLPSSIYLEVGYVGSKGTNLPLKFDGNRPIEPIVPGTGPPLSERRPNQDFSSVTTVKMNGQSTYNSLQIKLERRMSNGLSFLGSYTWAHTIANSDQSTLGGGSFIGKIQDIFNLAAEKGNAGNDIRHRFSAAVLYDLPVFSGSSSFVRTVLGSWRVSTIVTLQTGFPARIVGGGRTTSTGVFSRPSIVPGQDAKLPRSQRSRDRWFNTDAFTFPELGSFGTASRAPVHLPGLRLVDFSAVKNFRFAERFNLQFRAEFFNFFNHVNLGAPGVNIRRASSFGRITSSNQGSAGMRNPGRVIQFALKLQF